MSNTGLELNGGSGYLLLECYVIDALPIKREGNILRDIDALPMWK